MRPGQCKEREDEGTRERGGRLEEGEQNGRRESGDGLRGGSGRRQSAGVDVIHGWTEREQSRGQRRGRDDYVGGQQAGDECAGAERVSESEEVG